MLAMRGLYGVLLSMAAGNAGKAGWPGEGGSLVGPALQCRKWRPKRLGEARTRLYLWPMQPLKVGRLQRLGQAEAMVNGHQLQLRRVQARQAREPRAALTLTAHQDVPRVAVGVPDTDVQDADAVHVASREARGAHLARVAVMIHIFLQPWHQVSQNASTFATLSLLQAHSLAQPQHKGAQSSFIIPPQPCRGLICCSLWPAS